ncbi:AMP-binding protein [Porphyrobacter sp. YT40]|uniref:AMP-binding protein n=1 Tax=Porphyrobacter sp. YT40 TaxID=2547601 RepID=UPI0015E8A9D5|nr:AMP-binding protein [Porphyrobacter sp. YT40]
MAFAGANFGAVLKALAAAIPPGRPALVHGERVIGWGEFDAVTDRIAAGLRARGLQPGDIAGQMLRNTPEYLLAYFGCVKAGVVPVNVNYHYKARELADIFSRFGLRALFTESDFADLARGDAGGHADGRCRGRRLGRAVRHAAACRFRGA